jgi:hypothetical protein
MAETKLNFVYTLSAVCTAARLASVEVTENGEQIDAQIDTQRFLLSPYRTKIIHGKINLEDWKVTLGHLLKIPYPLWPGKYTVVQGKGCPQDFFES